MPALAASGGTASLTWNPPASGAVAGYRVYFGTASRLYRQPLGAGLNAGALLCYVVTDLPLGHTYYFAVTAFDQFGNESPFSNEATKHIQ
jgi:hypothetical protein